MRLWSERLEDRLMLAADDVISVGRVLSSWSAADIPNHQETITYTVYNDQADDATGIALSANLQPGVTLISASPPATQSGQNLSWNLGTLSALGRASVQIIVALGSSSGLQLDDGAQATATVDGAAAADTAPPAILRAAHIDPALVGSTLDANTSDPFIQQEAAKLDYDPNQIFRFLTQDIGYESYVGSLRGARGTLWSSAGNAVDQASLLIALLRSSGIPAQYVSGTLPVQQSQLLIASMFPETQLVTGFIEPGTATSDPQHDPAILAETSDHYWVQFDAGSGMTDADPTFGSAVIGQTFTTPTGTFTEVPDALRHKIEVRVSRELTTPAAGLLLGAPAQDVATVLDARFSTVELVGRPVTVGFFVQAHALSAIFSSSTNVYSPYLLVGGDSLAPNQDETIRGTDFSETLTNFPFGSQVVTGVFLDVDVTAPGGATKSYSTTLADRIGAAARINGGGSASLSGSAPLITPIDFTTLNILPALESRAAVVQDNAVMQQLASDFTALMSSISQLPAGAERDNQLAAAGKNFSDLLIAMSRSRLAQVAAGSDANTEFHEQSSLIKAYFGSPRIHVLTTRSNLQSGAAAAVKVAVDLLKNDIRAIALPQQVPEAVYGFRLNRGLTDTIVEQIALAPPDNTGHILAATGVARVFQLASDQRIGTALITPESRSQLDSLAITPAAKALITKALDAGEQVLTPTAMVNVDGTPRLAWLQANLQTGDIIGVFDDGSHGAFAEWAALEANDPAYNPDVQFNLGVLEAVIGDTTLVAIAKFMTWVYIGALQGLLPNNDPLNVTLVFKNNLTTLLNLYTEFVELAIPTTIEFKLGFLAGTAIAYKYTNDPPVDGFLLGPAPIPALEGLAASGGQLATKVVFDPLYSIFHNGAEVRTVFRLGIKNATSSPQTYAIRFGGVPSGFTAVASVPTITVPAGQTAEIGLALRPTGVIGAPGSDASFNITVTPASAPAQAITTSVPFTVPEIHGLDLAASPAIAQTLVATPATVQLTLHSTANVAQTVRLTATTSQGVTVSGLSDVQLAPGQTVIQTLTLTPDSNVPLNSQVSIVLHADYGAQLPQHLALQLHIAVPGADAIGSAAAAANQLGHTDLANRLNDLSIALTNLVQAPMSDVYKSQALAALAAVIALLSADPTTASLTAVLGGDRSALDQASGATTIQSAVVQLGNDLQSLSTTLSDEAAHRFTFSFLDNSHLGVPQVATTYQLVLQNTGMQTTTYDLSAVGLPAGVTATITPSTITLAPGQVTPGSPGVADVLVAVTSTSSTLISPFSFTVKAAVEGAAEISQTATGLFTPRSEVVKVVSVGTSPPFTNPGGQVEVTANILNAVNRQQTANVTYAVTDSTGNVVFTLPQPVPLTLNVLTTLTPVDLGPFDTTGLAKGNYTITVSVVGTSASGTGTLLVGTPVTASLTTTPATEPSGASTVTSTLQLSSQTPLAAPFTLIGQLAEGSSTSVAVSGSTAYVGTPGGIHVVNVTDPAHPVDLSTFGGSDVSGATTVQVQVYQNELVVLATRFDGSTNKLLVYSLASPASPTLLGQTPITLNGSPATGVNLSLAAIANNLVTTSAFWYRYFIFGGQIFGQFGESIVIDISNPAAPTIRSIIYNDPPDSNHVYPDGSKWPDGTSNIWQAVAADSHTVYLATTTATQDVTTGSAVQGIVEVADTTDPAAPKVLERLAIPDMAVVTGISVQGNRAFLIGSTKYWGSGTSGIQGNLVVGVLDITNPQMPAVLSTRVTTIPSIGVGNLLSLGGTLFATNSVAGPNGSAEMLLFNANDPSNIVVVPQSVPQSVNYFAAGGGLLFTTDNSNLLIYSLPTAGSSTAIPVTATVNVPTGTGVSIVPNSFNVPPTQIISGPSVNTLVWNTAITAANPNPTFTWKTTVTNLQPGESRAVVQDGTVEFSVGALQPVIVDLGAEVNANLQTYTGGSLYPAGGTVLNVGGKSFTLSNFPGGGTGVIQTGAAAPTSPSSFDIPVSVPNPVVVYTLINSAFGQFGYLDGTIEFAGTGGAHASFHLVQGTNIRDHNNDGFNNTIAPGTPSALFGGGVVRLDRQTFVLPSSFAGQTLTDVRLSGLGSNPTGQPFLAALTVDTSPTGTATFGAFPLPANFVTGQQIIGLSPPTQTAAPGATAPYSVTLTNPGSAAVVYNLSVQGVPAGWVDLPATMNVAAGGTVNVPLKLTSDSFAPTADYGFSVTASTAGGTMGSVQGDLVLQGQPVKPDVQSHGVAISIAPASGTAGQGTAALYTVRVTNTGSASENYQLSIHGLPAGIQATFGQNDFDVPPGAGNFRDVPLALQVPVGVAPAAYGFFVAATSSADASVTDTVPGSLSVLGLGVAADILSGVASPGSTLQLLVTNTGQTTDTYDLTLGGPAAIVSTLDHASLTLAAGASEQVAIHVGDITSALPGSLLLSATARSRTDQAIVASDTASVGIGATAGLSASVQPQVKNLTAPGAATLLLEVNNLGNTDDAYAATILETGGPLAADLIGLNGEPTNTIPTFRLTGLAAGAIVVSTNLTAAGQGTVKVKVTSLNHPELSSIVTATVTSNPSGMSMDCSPLHVGLNTCTIFGGTPGGLVGLAMGTHAGSAQLSPFQITLGMTDGKVVAQGVVQPDGRAVVQFRVDSATILNQLRLQGFEQAPHQQTTNITIVGLPQVAAGGQGSGGAALDASALPALREAAIERWQAAGISPIQLAQLRAASVQIADLADGFVGQTVNNEIFLDSTAAGYGWFVDTTPGNDSEYSATAATGRLTAQIGAAAAGHMDALTVLMHEFGHILGRTDLLGTADQGVMSATLSVGERRLPAGSPAILSALYLLPRLYTNLGNPLDVDGDGIVAPIDALLTINALNALSAGLETASTNPSTSGNPLLYLDVDGDGYLAPTDALQIINYLNRSSVATAAATPSTAEGESESCSSSSSAEQDDTFSLLLETLAPDIAGAESISGSRRR